MSNDAHALSELGEAAIEYVRLGWAVIPLGPRSKVPMTKRGLKDWTDDEDSVRKIWGRYPDANIGVVCGDPSKGLCIIDLDVDDDKGIDGTETLSAWERINGELPETVTAITGRGGMHVAYRVDRDIHPSANGELGVDIRCDKSYFVAPPSIHPNGHRYEWETPPSEHAIVDADAKVYDFISSVQRNGGTVDETSGGDADRAKPKFVLPATIDSDRNVTLFKYAAHLRSVGRPDDEITNSVIGANYARCRPPLEVGEVRKIVTSALRYDAMPDADGTKTPAAKKSFIGKNGALQPNLLARTIIEERHACKIGGTPSLWCGDHYEMGVGAIYSACIDYHDSISTSQQREVVSYITHSRLVPYINPASGFDGKAYVAFVNGVLDPLDDDMICGDKPLLTATPKMFITNVIPHEYVPMASTPESIAFLDSLSCGSPSVFSDLQQIIGAAMCSSRVVASSPMLVGRAAGEGGEASNGKSSYLSVIRQIIGDRNVSSLDMATLGQRFQSQRIVGKLANIGDDIPNGFLKGDELSTFKKAVTGDRLYCDVKGADGFEFDPTALLVFSMNQVPRLGDVSEGTLRRMQLVPFRARFVDGDPGCDPHIVAKMAEEENVQSLIFQGVIGLSTLLHNGGVFTTDPEMEEEVAEVKRDNDTVCQWIYDEAINTPDIVGGYVQNVFERYQKWCEESGIQRPVSKKAFTRRINSRFLTITSPIYQYQTGKTVRTFIPENKND